MLEALDQDRSLYSLALLNFYLISFLLLRHHHLHYSLPVLLNYPELVIIALFTPVPHSPPQAD